MKLRTLFAALTVAFTASFFAAPAAVAEGTASLRVKNDASYDLDCRFMQKNVTLNYGIVSTGTTSEARGFAVNDDEWGLMCKKANTPPVKKGAPLPPTAAPPVMLKGVGGHGYVAACSQNSAGSLNCAIIDDPAGQQYQSAPSHLSQAFRAARPRPPSPGRRP